MHQKRFIYLFVFLSTFLTYNLWSQEPSSNFNFVNIKEGISKVGIYSITQDQNGFMWIGTNGSGLYKFDGNDYTSYKFKINDSISLSSNLVFCSYLDKSNKLWIGTEDGLNLYDRDLDQFKKIAVVGVEHFNISVLSMKEDNNGSLYIGTRQFGLFKMNLSTGQVINIPNKDGNILSVNNIHINDNNEIILATSLGLREVDTTNKQIVNPKIDNKIDGIDFNAPIQYLQSDDEGNLWAGTYTKGVYKYEFDTHNNVIGFSRFPISNKRILSIIQLTDTSLLIGTENDGLFHVNNNGELIKNYVYDKTDENSIRSNSIWSLFLDANQRIWMGYYNNGVALSDELYDKFNNIESLANNTNSLQIGSVTSIAKDKSGKFWISMDGGGIDVYNPVTSKIDHINVKDTQTFSGLTSDYIQSVFIDSKENVWAGSWDNGIYILKKGENKFININIQNSDGELLSNAILSFDEDKDGIIWIGTFYSGLYSYNPETEQLRNHNSSQFENEGITNSDVRKILVDAKRAIWLGTTEGLFRIDKLPNSELAVTSFSKRMTDTLNGQKSANHILSLYESSDNFIWIGTRGAGLCRYDKTKDEFKWYNKFSGLNEENVAGIIEGEDKNLWISGNSGISKLNVDTNEIVNYTIYDGLLSNDFNFNATLKDNDGTLYFGNYRGIDYFEPKKIKTNTVVPSLYLTGLKLFNKEVIPDKKQSPLKKVLAETKSLVLNHTQSVFTIEYTGINYTRSEKNQYAYYLEGLEDTWNYVGNLRSATYTNLDYGDYIFKLKAANNDGVWNETPLTLKITILSPWWKTTAAIISYILLFFFGVYLLNKVTKGRIKEKEAIRNERIQRVQEDKLNEKKLQFFTNISHEFRTPLTLMINPLKDILRDSSSNLSNGIRQKIGIIHKNTDRLHRLINELMDFRKLELNKMDIRAKEFDLVSFTKNIVSYFKEESVSRNIYLTVGADVPDLNIWADQSMLEKIIFNILSNAVKVTPDNGAINIDILSADDLMIMPLVDENKPIKVFEIRISDTGSGLEVEQVNRIFERFYQVENLNRTYYGGTGIGLEVVQSFVYLHKGKVEVESDVNKGTTFRIILPAGKDHFSKEQLSSVLSEQPNQKEKFSFESNNQNIVVEPEATVKNTTKSSTLLIVEDSSELRNYLKLELKNQYKILTAINGKEGLKLAKQETPDIILTDVIMPEMDGFEFCKHIKKDIKTSHIPLLMLTAKTRLDDRMEGIGYGADAYMVKPFDMQLLKLRLAQLITSRRLIFDKYFGEISGNEEYSNATSIDKEFIEKVLKYIGENMSDSDLSVELLASQLNLSRSQLYRKIKTLTGQTVNEFLRKIRLQKAKQILETGNLNISEVCYKVGFSSPSYFTKCFKAHFGIPPTDVKVKES